MGPRYTGHANIKREYLGISKKRKGAGIKQPRRIRAEYNFIYIYSCICVYTHTYICVCMKTS